jgi:hypothetical protein
LLKRTQKKWENKWAFSNSFLKKTWFWYHENEHNLGYDANIRKLIGLSQFKWVILIGNDDLFLKAGIYCRLCESILILLWSRDHLFVLKQSLGTHRSFAYFTNWKLYQKRRRSEVDFLGLAVLLADRNQYRLGEKSTTQYDGTLYQIYLAAHAYCTQVAWLAKPFGWRSCGQSTFVWRISQGRSASYCRSLFGESQSQMWCGVLQVLKM